MTSFGQRAGNRSPMRRLLHFYFQGGRITLIWHEQLYFYSWIIYSKELLLLFYSNLRRLLKPNAVNDKKSQKKEIYLIFAFKISAFFHFLACSESGQIDAIVFRWELKNLITVSIDDQQSREQQHAYTNTFIPLNIEFHGEGYFVQQRAQKYLYFYLWMYFVVVCCEHICIMCVPHSQAATTTSSATKNM